MYRPIYHWFLYSNKIDQTACIRGGFRGGGGPPGVSYFCRLRYFSLKKSSANYKTLGFGPRCQENAYLALGFSFLRTFGAKKIPAPSAFKWGGGTPPPPLSKIPGSAPVYDAHEELHFLVRSPSNDKKLDISNSFIIPRGGSRRDGRGGHSGNKGWSWGGGHSGNIDLCYKGFEGSPDPLLRV